jgi:hypothetical protein
VGYTAFGGIMSLTDLWEKSKTELQAKNVQQIISFAGDGNLTDGSTTSEEFRAFLKGISTDLIQRYADQCLNDSFSGSGFVLQDIVNQIGNRLGFKVEYGRYRGVSGQIGYDGLWELPSGHNIVIEVKTTDAYRIDLNKLADYRKKLIKDGLVEEKESSVLIVVGRKDTGDLEAQIRGSRHAWDMRLISIDALVRLMLLKQQVEDPAIIQKMYDLLIPREFTKLDEIVEIVFFTAEDIIEEEPAEENDSNDMVKKKVPKFTPVAFHQKCVDRIEKHLGATLVKQTRTQYSSSDGSLSLICIVSKEHVRADQQRGYWFIFHPHQRDILQNSEKAYISFGCGSEALILLIPANNFVDWIDGFNMTVKEEREYWHVYVIYDGDKAMLIRKKEYDAVDLTKYILN